MVQRGQDVRFSFEARHARGFDGEHLRQDLDRDVAVQPRVARTVHLSHAAGAQQLVNFARSYSRLNTQCYDAGYAHLLRFEGMRR
jgi:hypothetical protein